MPELTVPADPTKSLEERLVDQIKERGFALLIDDDTALVELAKRAVDKALLAPTRVQGRYGIEDAAPPVVAAARTIAQQAAESIIAAEVERITADPEIMKALRQALADSFPQAMMNAAASMFQTVSQHASFTSVENLRTLIQQRAI